MAALPRRGEIWSADLTPTRGHEQSGSRPVLVISTDTYNHGPAGLVVVLPVTRTDRRVAMHVAISPPEGGLTSTSFILCDAVRSIAVDRLGAGPWGRILPATQAAVDERLRVLMEL